MSTSIPLSCVWIAEETKCESVETSCEDIIEENECNTFITSSSGDCFWIKKNGLEPEKQCKDKVLVLFISVYFFYYFTIYINIYYKLLLLNIMCVSINS
jgi:hypothetical protein